MNEKLKMLNGELYYSFDEELIKDRLIAKKLLHKYNCSKPKKTNKRQAILKRLFDRSGGKIHIEPPFYCDYGYNISIGENFYSNHNLIILD